MTLLTHIDPSWTLFLDRDGVINIEKHLDYIRHKEELVLYPNLAENFYKFNQTFQLVIVVTNQRGIGKGLMTVEDLKSIHSEIDRQLALHQAHIDAYYFAPELDSDAPNRKPNTGMGLQAQIDFPSIDFQKSIMIGNNMSDMEFGKRLGMKTIYTNTTKPITQPVPTIDMIVENLLHFAQLL